MTPISDLLGRLEAVEKTGDGWLARCPVESHADAHASLVIHVASTGRLLWHCRAGCSQGAVMSALGIRGDERWSSDRVTDAESKGPASETAMQGLERFVTHCEEALAAHPEALNYADSRFSVADQVSRLRLGFSDGSYGWRLLGQKFNAVPRLIVPFFDADGSLIGMQGRALEDGDDVVRWCGPTNPSDGTWARHSIWRSDVFDGLAIVTEGPGDALAAYSIGLTAVAIRGASASPQVADGLCEVLSDSWVAVAGDNDRAGKGFASRMTAWLRSRGIEAGPLELPAGVNDIAEWMDRRPGGFASELYEAVRAGRAAAPSAPLSTSPVAVSERFVGSMGDRLRWCDELGFFVEERGCWHSESSLSVRGRFKEFAGERLLEARALLEDATIGGDDDAIDEAQRAVKAWAKYENTRPIDDVITELGSLRDIRIEAPELDRHPDLLAVTNGVVDLRTGELLEPDPDLMITRQLDIGFDPDAEAPRWEQFLSEVFSGSAAMPDFMRRLVGYGITGHTSEQCFSVLLGTGANGKSIFTDTLAHVFSPISETTPFSTFERKQGGGIPNDLAALRSARLVFGSEGEQGAPMAEAVLKRVTGQDMITARFMRKEFFSFRPSFLMFLATNHAPRFTGQDDGLWRRVKLVRFDRYFADHERDHYLAETLRGEAEGILNWAVRGATEWYSSGLKDPQSVASATQDFKDVSDRLAGFIGEVLAHGTDEVSGAAVHRAYVAWLDDADRGARPWTARTLYAELRERGFETFRDKRGVVFSSASLPGGEEHTEQLAADGAVDFKEWSDE